MCYKKQCLWCDRGVVGENKVRTIAEGPGYGALICL